MINLCHRLGPTPFRTDPFLFSKVKGSEMTIDVFCGLGMFY